MATKLTRSPTLAQLANLEPWFPPHLQRQIYSSLLEIAATDGEKKTKVPDSVIRAALLRRAVEDIARIIQVRQAKQALNVLLQRGSVGEDLNARFQRAEKEIEEELREVVMEVSTAPFVSMPAGCCLPGGAPLHGGPLHSQVHMW